MFSQEHTFKNCLNISQAWLHQANSSDPAPLGNSWGKVEINKQCNASVNGDIFAPTLKKFEFVPLVR